jgi:hypothetical protein
MTTLDHGIDRVLAGEACRVQIWGRPSFETSGLMRQLGKRGVGFVFIPTHDDPRAEARFAEAVEVCGVKFALRVCGRWYIEPIADEVDMAIAPFVADPVPDEWTEGWEDFVASHPPYPDDLLDLMDDAGDVEEGPGDDDEGDDDPASALISKLIAELFEMTHPPIQIVIADETDPGDRTAPNAARSLRLLKGGRA